MPKLLKQLLVPLLILLSVYFVQAQSPITNGYDSLWTIHTATSLLQEGNLNLDEYRAQLKARGLYGARKKRGHYYNYFPPGTALLITPILAGISIFPELSSKLIPCRAFRSETINPIKHSRCVERALASLIVAATAVVIYFISLNYLSIFASCCTGLIFAFGTSAWSIASRALWQHGPSMLMLSLALLLAIKARTSPQLIRWAAIPLACSYIIRPTNSLSLAVFCIYVFCYYREYFPRFLLWSSVVLAPFILCNLTIYGSLLPGYYRPQRIEITENFFNAISANLFSPARGLFVFSPMFLIPCYWLVKSIFNRSLPALDAFITIIIILHLAVVSSFSSWWAGHTFGPRFMSDLLPYLMFFFARSLAEIKLFSQRNQLFFAAFIALSCAWSCVIHSQGAYSNNVYRWNVYPHNIDSKQSRVWDWRNPQFLAGLIK